MRVLLVHPGSLTSTGDVYEGLRYGLEHHGVSVVDYHLDGRLVRVRNWMHYCAREARKTNPEVPDPTNEDILREASQPILSRALKFEVDVVLIISAFCVHPDVMVLLKRAGIRVCVLFTETPYATSYELQIAAIVDGCWTNERSALQAFRNVNPNSGYLPHAWHPLRHRPEIAAEDPETPSHDVVFVGSVFNERAQLFNAIDWTGIDFGLYGTIEKGTLSAAVSAHVRGGPTLNVMTSALYRRAKIGLNIYRTSMGFSLQPGCPQITQAESLNPRAYELAACGVFHLSDHRVEVTETFGDLVPTFRTPEDASALIRYWLGQDTERRRVATLLPARVAESSWVDRSILVIGDVQRLLETGGRMWRDSDVAV